MRKYKEIGNLVCGKTYVDEYGRKLMYVAPWSKYLARCYVLDSNDELGEVVYLNQYAIKYLKEV